VRISTPFLAVAAACVSAVVQAAPIDLIDPSNGIASIRIVASAGESQFHVTFAQDMIPLGGGHGDFPVTLEGPAQCRWGWRGPRTLTCMLDSEESLPLAERYALVIGDGLQSISGEPVPPFRYDFETERPMVHHRGTDWDTPVSPVLYLFTNVPVTTDELEKHVVLEPLMQASTAVRVDVATNPDPYRYPAANQQFIAKPGSPLLPDTEYQIRILEGLSGTNASLTGEEHDARTFRTHAAYEFLGIGCDRLPNESRWQRLLPHSILSEPHCAPERSVALLFSAEPDARGLYGTLTQAGLPPEIARTLDIHRHNYRISPRPYLHGSKSIYGIHLSGFSAGAAHDIELPATIRDRFGRTLNDSSARFHTTDFAPAFLNQPGFGVIPSGFGRTVEISSVNTDTIFARLWRDDQSESETMEFNTNSPGANQRSRTRLDVEKILDKSWGVLIGSVFVNEYVMNDKDTRRQQPNQYRDSVGAIVSPWDVIAATQYPGKQRRQSVWVSSFATGNAISNAHVELLGSSASYRERDQSLYRAYQRGNVFGSGRTDRNGYAEIVSLSQEPTDIYRSMIRVTKGKTVVVLPLQQNQFSHHIADRSGLRPRHYDNAYNLMEGSIITWGITDKPLYRRGETVRIKGYARVRDDNRFRIPAARDGWALKCSGYRTDLCSGRTLDLDEYGAFDTTLELSDAAVDGDYSVTVQPSGQNAISTFGFTVANFKPRPHKVTLHIPIQRLDGDDMIPLEASAEYFAGGAVRNAEAQVFVETRTKIPIGPEPRYANYYFGERYWYRDQPAQTFSQASFDAEGRLTGSFELPAESPASGTATVTVGALHASGEWAYSKPVSIPYVINRYVLGIKEERDTIPPGQPFDASVVLIDSLNEDTGSLTVVQTLEYPSSRYNSYIRPTPDIVDTCTIAIAPDKPVSCQLTPTRIGHATLRATLMQANEELLQVERAIRVEVASPRFRQKPSDNLDMQTSKPAYRADETAEVVIDVPYDKATVLFSIRRNFLLDQWRDTFSKGKHTLSIPLTERHTPGFTFTAIARPTASLPGTANGAVRVEVNSLVPVPTLAVTPDAESYKAGEEVTLRLASDAPGVTQIAVAVVDEAVLDLVPDLEDLFDPQGKNLAGMLRYWSGFSWWQLARGMVQDLSSEAFIEEIVVFAQRSASAGGPDLMRSMEDTSVAAESDMRLRHDFAEAAFFEPNLLTSNDGQAELSFTVPDNLGRWRVIAVGADTEGHLFADTSGFNVTMPLEVRADMPHRLIEGDSLQARATVLSRKEEPTDVTLSLELHAGDAGVVQQQESALLDTMETFAVTAKANSVNGGELKLVARANDAEDADGLIVSSPVNVAVESRSWTSTAPVSGDDTVVQPIQIPLNALEKTTRLRLTLDRSVIGDLSQAFHYMSEEGHRSWEQILSRAVAVAYAGVWVEGTAYRVSKFEMTNRLMTGSNFQNAGGGMNHFRPRDDYADDYLSAYTYLALSWIGELGFELPQYRERLYQYLVYRINSGLRGRTSYRFADIPSVREMPIMIAALSSAEHENARFVDQYSQYLLSNIGRFDIEGIAFALLAATNMNASADLRAELSARLQANLVETFDRTEISGGGYRFGNRNELYCTVLMALQDAREHTPEPRALAKLIRGGYEFRVPESGFGNTHANALCLHSLTRYRDSYEAPREGLAARATAPNLEPVSLTLAVAEDTVSSDPVSVPLDNLATEISVGLVEGQVGYASTNIRYDVDLSKEIERSHGYTLKRTYSVFRNNDWLPLASGTTVEVGDWVRIELAVMSPVVRRFVAISDQTPAGLEPTDPALSSTMPAGVQQGYRWWYPFSEQALSNEKSRFYAQWLTPGSTKVTYYAQARFAGEFIALPAKVESMYSDGVFATTAPGRLRIEPETQ